MKVHCDYCGRELRSENLQDLIREAHCSAGTSISMIPNDVQCRQCFDSGNNVPLRIIRAQEKENDNRHS